VITFLFFFCPPTGTRPSSPGAALEKHHPHGIDQLHPQLPQGKQIKNYFVQSPLQKKSIVKIPWSIGGYQMIILWYTLRKKGFIGVLYMKHRVLYSTPKNLLC